MLSDVTGYARSAQLSLAGASGRNCNTVLVHGETNVEPRTPGPETKGAMNRRNVVERLAEERQELRTYVGHVTRWLRCCRSFVFPLIRFDPTVLVGGGKREEL